MPYVTQTRTPPRKVATGSYYFDGRLVRTEGGAQGSVFDGRPQTTTSYRGSAEDDYERLTGEQIREMFRRDYKFRNDSGHPFKTSSQSIEWPLRSTRLDGWTQDPVSKYHRVTYVGDVVPQLVSGSLFAATAHPTASELEAYGRAAIAATSPTKPEAGLAQFLGELRERIPQLIGTDLYRQGVRPRSMGSEYLNVEFGWKPIISDVQKFARAAAQASLLTRQFVADSDKIVRRRRLLVEESTVVPSVTGLTATIKLPRMIATDPYPGSSTWTVGTESMFFKTLQLPARIDQTNYKKVWFAGAYQYHVAQVHDFLSRVEQWEQKANHLLGTRITPDLIYELTPWSWLFDWFGDFGTFVRNLTLLSSDSLVLRYGYVMCTTRAERTLVVENLQPRDPSQVSGFTAEVPRVATLVAKSETKERIRASPYGFGLKSGAFTSRQWAILAALGMTKGDRRLAN